MSDLGSHNYTGKILCCPANSETTEFFGAVEVCYDQSIAGDLTFKV